ncbi:unnamed protein product [Vitrella brassicaformis CCMP3155]|uniref:Uncharacterized protein n=1 Tax=Vitrella brassicaformis (strain CCMP3155) TaxID=1169540 RepID=A0A0G4H5D4_VITBC|nr:unnamed protein product [Vitrella brassicaformis CCMP3155]|eukprot:CEM38837.1 unnamed protein product [Vitrella brassicaformis CCMP3155]
MALAAGLGWVGITVWGKENVFEYPNRPGELFIEVTSPLSGDAIVTRLAEGDKGVRFLDFSTSPPIALPIGQRPSNNPSLANGGGATLRRRTGTSPSGARYEVVQEGTGRVPTLNDRVKIDWVEWWDAFDGQNKACDYPARGPLCLP